MKTLATALVAVLILSGSSCVSSRVLVERQELARVSEDIRRACRGVVDIPDQDLNDRVAADLWAIDRSRLGECARRHDAAVQAIEAIEGQGR